MSLSPRSTDLPHDPPLHRLEPGDRLVRFYNPAHGPWNARRSFGPHPEARFDHHLPPLGLSPDRGVWYAASSLIGAVAEAFGNLRFIDKGSGRRVCVVHVRAPLAVVDLAGVAARAFGLDQRIGTTTEYDRTQEWARAFYERYPSTGGLRWRGRQAGSVCFVLTDHTDMTRLAAVADRDIADPAVWPRIARAAQRARLRIVA